jgi:hypothetical protein
MSVLNSSPLGQTKIGNTVNIWKVILKVDTHEHNHRSIRKIK